MNRMPNRVEPKRIEIDLKFAIMIGSYFMCLQGVNLKFLCKGKECFGMRQTNFTSTKHHIANTWLCWSCRFHNKNVTSWNGEAWTNSKWWFGKGTPREGYSRMTLFVIVPFAMCSKHLLWDTIALFSSEFPLHDSVGHAMLTSERNCWGIHFCLLKWEKPIK